MAFPKCHVLNAGRSEIALHRNPCWSEDEICGRKNLRSILVGTRAARDVMTSRRLGLLSERLPQSTTKQHL